MGFPPWNFGGIGTWAGALATGLERHGSNRVTVLIKRGGIDTNLTPSNTVIPFVFMRGHAWKKHHYAYTYFYVRKYLRRHSNAIILAANWRLARSAVDLKSRYNAHLITAAHGKEVSQLIHEKGAERERFEKVVHGSDAVIAVSRYTEKQIYDFCLKKPANIHFIPNGTDPQIFTPAENGQMAKLKQAYHINPDTKVLLTLARLVPRKGHDTVIQALSEVIKTYPDTLYIIAGPESASWKERLTTMVSDLHLEDYVRFLGKVSEGEKLNLYRLCDIYLMVSKNPVHTGDSEGFGITFLEANACGKPVIGSRTGGIPDAVEHNVSGLLVKPDDVDGTRQAIVRLLSDDAIRTRFGRQGRERVENRFSWDHTVKRVLNIIDGLAQDANKDLRERTIRSAAFPSP